YLGAHLKYLHPWEKDCPVKLSISWEMPRYFKFFPAQKPSRRRGNACLGARGDVTANVAGNMDCWSGSMTVTTNVTPGQSLVMFSSVLLCPAFTSIPAANILSGGAKTETFTSKVSWFWKTILENSTLMDDSLRSRLRTHGRTHLESL